MKPPALARRLLRALLPAAHREVVVGDLDEEFERYVSRARTALGARAWYWRQAMRSMSPALRLRARGGAARFGRDVRYAGRQLWRSPEFTFVVTLTLSLGVAATTAVVSVASAVLLRPLPYADPDRLVSIAIPRIRDFRGLNPNAFDGHGDYTLGLTEQLIFPEIDYDKVLKIRGMDITVVTTARNDDEGRALLVALGFPFEGIPMAAAS